MCLKIALYSLFGQLGFYLKRKQRFQPGALLKMPPAYFTEKFGVDIQK